MAENDNLFQYINSSLHNIFNCFVFLGSSITIRYEEPRKIIKLPLDLSTLTDAERKARLDARKPRKKIKIEDEVVDNFNANKYLKYLKKK